MNPVNQRLRKDKQLCRKFFCVIAILIIFPYVAGTFGLYETKGCQTTITVSEKMEIAGMNKDVTYTLSKDDLKRNITALFALYEFDVKGLDIEDGLSSQWEGYGMMEHTVDRAYFNGITVNLEKAKNVGLKKQYN